MAQVDTGIRKILNVPLVYDLFHFFIGANNVRKAFAKEYIRAFDGAKILEIGCGFGNMLPFLPDVYYDGYDINPMYIEEASKRYKSEKIRFFCKEVANIDAIQNNYYDYVIAYGVLHHLNDEEVNKLSLIAKKSLIPNGKFVTLDGVFLENQNKIAKWILKKDRGQNIRDTVGYEKLLLNNFRNIKYSIRNDLLRIPYSLIILMADNQKI